jgi:hypothetical protein
MHETLPRELQVSEVLRTLAVHDHLCLIYETPRQLLDSAVPFFLIGLDRGEKCLYVADENTISALLDGVQAEGIDVDAVAEKGLLTVANKEQTYLRKGYFDPDEMIHYWAGKVEEAKARGFSALRFAAEASWALGGDPGTERLIEYEARLNLFLTNYDAVCICQYNSKRFSPKVILQILRTHPLVSMAAMSARTHTTSLPRNFSSPTKMS